MDELHATVLAAVLRILGSSGWEAQVEVTFSTGGERGSIDILAWSPPRRLSWWSRSSPNFQALTRYCGHST
jgi:hypothetical protein